MNTSLNEMAMTGARKELLMARLVSHSFVITSTL